MGYLNPLLRLPAGRKLLGLPDEDRRRIEAVMRELRDQANDEAEKAWRRRKGPMAAYWRAVATYARHIAHALSKTPRARTSQQVLKAEGCGPDATDRDCSANASPLGGAMGAEQPAAAGLDGAKAA